jgi:hypothetical protein
MRPKDLIFTWFSIWESGNYNDLPLTEDFSHTSPYGTLEGRTEYLNLVAANEDKFLGHTFQIHDLLIGSDRACIRYTAIKDEFSLDVTEWHFFRGDKICKIIACYTPIHGKEDFSPV